MKMNTGLIVIILVAVAFAAFYFIKNKDSAPMMNPQEFKTEINQSDGVIIDVRTADEFEDGHLQRVDHNFDVMSGEFQSKLDSLDKNQTYYLYCRSGNRSGKAAKMMKQNGFEKVNNIGGYQDLVDAGFDSSN
jgi:phage shock protein E